MEKYVKPDAEIAVEKPAPKPVVLADVEAKIMEIVGDIDALAVQKKLAITGLSESDADVLLRELHAQGKLKTKAERIAELTPAPEGAEPKVELEK